MDGLLYWLLERKALTVAGFVVVLLGAFVPWPSIAIAGVVVGIGAVLMLAQIPFAMRAAQQGPARQMGQPPAMAPRPFMSPPEQMPTPEEAPAPELVTAPHKDAQPGD